MSEDIICETIVSLIYLIDLKMRFDKKIMKKKQIFTMKKNHDQTLSKEAS
jgi:hypothetical protein